MLSLCSFGFGCTVIWKRRGVHHTQGQGGVVAGESVSDHYQHTAWERGPTEGVQRYCNVGDGLGEGAYSEAGVTAVGYLPVSISSGDSGVDCIASCNLYRRLHPILSLIILLYNQLHTPSFPPFHLTDDFRVCEDVHNCVDHPGRVVLYHHTLIHAPPTRTILFHKFPLNAARGVAVC
jgi:hypothetical protein